MEAWCASDAWRRTLASILQVTFGPVWPRGLLTAVLQTPMTEDEVEAFRWLCCHMLAPGACDHSALCDLVISVSLIEPDDSVALMVCDFLVGSPPFFLEHLPG